VLLDHLGGVVAAVVQRDHEADAVARAGLPVVPQGLVDPVLLVVCRNDDV